MEVQVDVVCPVTNRSLNRQKILLYPGGTQVLSVGMQTFPVELRFRCKESHYEGNSIYDLLQRGIQSTFGLEIGQPTADVRDPVHYIKGFNEGAQSVIEHAEARLASFVKYMSNHLEDPRLAQMCSDVLAEWKYFQEKGR
jgi:hypothetical protein